MSDIAFQWEIIGECLEIKYTYLASLKSKTSSDIEKLSKVLQLWMDTMPKPVVTWNTILQTIENPPIENRSVVTKMEFFFKCKCYNYAFIRFSYFIYHCLYKLVVIIVTLCYYSCSHDKGN